MMLAAIETERNTTVILSETITTNLKGLVKWREPSKGDKWHYLVQVIEIRGDKSDLIRQNVIVSVNKKHEHFIPGEIIEGIASLSPPPGPALSGLFESSFFNYYKGISATGFFYSIPRSYLENDNNIWEQPLFKIKSFLNEIRTNIGIYIRKKIPGDTGALAAALVTDERRAISQETINDLQKSGIAHIIAISGINMTIAAGLFFLVMRSIFSSFPIFAEKFPIKKIASLGALITVTAYFLISGASISAQRAYFMVIITLISYIFDKHLMGLRSIALTAIVIICFFPSEVMGASFQMSFATTAALIASSSIWQKKISTPHPLLVILPDKGIIITAIVNFFKVIFLTSLIGSASASIFLIKHFHCMPIYGIIANIITIPILSFIVMPAGIIAVPLIFFSLDGIPLYVMGWGLDLIIIVAHKIANIGDNFCTGKISSTLFIVTIVGFLILTLLKTNIRHIGTAILTIATPILLFFPSYKNPDIIIAKNGKLVAFLDKNTLISNQLNPNNFILSQWQSSLKAPIYEGPLIKKVKSKKIGLQDIEEMIESMPEKKFICFNKSFCLGHSKGSIISTIKRKENMQLICQLSDIIITTIKDMKPKLCKASLFIDPEMLQKKGSLEIKILSKENKQDRPVFIVNNAIENIFLPWNKHRNQKIEKQFI
ncbi:ComEC/Rec2 family competence protein [Candidatus Liberibacter americanus]|uniref:Multitransmembrane, metal-binding protein n=1 Tax=Candidatus Liberibacter americanus str. Sao Paulo TaxID=1261131 RepID=U6B531_9HYPH|nr:ComEC/Rec2 family competence protein [Candidatus Liberibacter americanus]AHA27693.1 multitransmembrane, metal-binding protein [Candidatus Liberibacter americanus str. Sao Paulo]